jgi:hypothetical protein
MKISLGNLIALVIGSMVIGSITIAPIATPAAQAIEAQQSSPRPRSTPNTNGRSVTPPDPNCPIKGNISQAGSGQSTGRRLYHVPGMQDYDRTVIDPARGERWFCTEAEAQAAGWTRAPR